MVRTYCRDWRIDMVITRYVILIQIGHQQFAWNYRPVKLGGDE